jgi:hypothetical protein
MTRHLSLGQLTLLVVGIFLIGSLLILLIYALHTAFRRQREAGDSKRASPRPPDEAAFAMATISKGDAAHDIALNRLLIFWGEIGKLRRDAVG